MGMGTMGWTEEETLQTTLPAIEIAYRGRCKFVSKIIEAVFGGGKSPTAAVATREMSPELFDAVFS